MIKGDYRMKQYNCAEQGHHYGIWTVKKNGIATRQCECCGFIRQLPNNPNIMKQIKKQDIALKIWQNFEKISNEDSDIFWYLSCILTEVFPYLDTKAKDQLAIRLKELQNSSNISAENTSLLEQIINVINIKDDNAYWEIIDIFQEQNQNLLTTPIELLKADITETHDEMVDILETTLTRTEPLPEGIHG